MAGSSSPFLESISLEGFLSFGPGESTIPLLPLNVLIGPNGAGKSNLIEAISVLRAVPRDLSVPFPKDGRGCEWLWAGPPRAERARISIVVDVGHVARSIDESIPVRYALTFGDDGSSFLVLDERLEAQSALSQRKDPDTYPERTRLAAALNQIRIYRSWAFGPEAIVRESCRADDRNDKLSETLDNLPARLAVLKRDPTVKKRLLECLHELAPELDDLEIVPQSGRLQLHLVEGSRTTSARGLSDGTLKFLCLLAILLDPSPPPLIVLEQPELGMHPDTFPMLHDLLVEASQRGQIIVATHSSSLLDSFTEQPESILVFDKREGSTVVSRVGPKEGEGLASRWLSGQIGGTRW